MRYLAGSPRLIRGRLFVFVCILALSLSCNLSSLISGNSPKSGDSSDQEIASTSAPDIANSAETVEVLFDISNPKQVFNGASSPSKFTSKETWKITQIYTYHWNDGQGQEPSGTISLESEDGTLYGPWETIGVDGQGGVAYAYWVAYPDETIPAGTYTVIDSDPGTWSQNNDSDGAGFVTIQGIRVKE